MTIPSDRRRKRSGSDRPRDPSSSRRRRGRPTLPPEALRSQSITLRLTAEEKRLLEILAERSGLPLRTFMLIMALTGTIFAPPPIGNRQLYRALARIGNNLNQHVKQIHEGKVPPDNLPLLLDLQATVRDLANAALTEAGP
jgi:hypothetical protein